MKNTCYYSSFYTQNNNEIYKGKTKYKYECLKKYHFNFALQNTFTNDHFLSPIFESFYCSSIPLYLGAKNIEEYIPENYYIDLRKFKNFNEIYHFINSLIFKEILNYKNNIYNYLQKNMYERFTPEFQMKKLFNILLSN